jgi:hypothetical protein
MSDSITVKNSSGQVSTFLIDGDADPRKAILEQRIARGELEKVSKTTKSAPRGRRTRVVVVDSDAGLTDEKGDLLKSVHGGGHDPDADGDVAGDPSGSKEVEGAVKAAEAVSDAAIAQAEAKPQSAPAKKVAVAKKAAAE